MMTRINKWISQNSEYSRRQVDQLIIDGQIKVNGKIVTELGIKVSDRDEIVVQGIVIDKQTHFEYFLLNKPKGYISSTKDEKKRKVITDLIFDNMTHIYPVGRLDYNTTGLIILTSDGDFANLLMHPKQKIAKTYLAKIKGYFSEEMRLDLEKKQIPYVKDLPAKIVKKQYNPKKEIGIVQVTIYEGKNHQVKKMFEAYNLEVLSLERINYFNFDLKKEKLLRGQYRVIKPVEVRKIKNELTVNQK